MFEFVFVFLTFLYWISDFVSNSFTNIAELFKIIRIDIYQPVAEYCAEGILGVSEELAKSVVRECFQHSVRFINGFFAWIVSLFDKASKLWTRTQKTAQAFPQIKWDNLRPSSLNWIVERESESDGLVPCSSDCNTDQESHYSSRWEWFCKGIRSFTSSRRLKDPTRIVFPSHWIFEQHLGYLSWENERRRGWVEEVHLALEMAITDLFVILRRVARFLLWIPVKQPNECSISSSEGSISLNRNEIRGQECTQGPSNPSRLSKVFSMPNLRTRKARVRGLITAEHFITEAGYPQESHTVTTDDGYILYLHRLPRPNATRTVFFQHGILDTSLGWVCSGVTDSLAFSAWDQGYDVWLGNSRSNPPRHHNDPNISTDQYWRYTLNELGMKDIGAQLEYIHQIKCSELESGLYGDSTMLHRCKSETFTDPDSVDPPSEGDDDNDTLPYSLFVVGHSLGAAALLVYLVTSLYEKKTHYIRRIILMSPAGFHHVFPIVLHPFRWILPPIAWLMEHGFGRKGIPLMIPGSFTRLFVFKILQDIVQYPAIREFVKRSIRWAMNGDVSPWEFALQLPHYDVHSMPGISVHTTLHLIQFISSGRFQLYDYGSPVQNMRHYGLPAPLDLASEYWRIDIPVDIVAGTNDGVIPPECVRLHVTHMRDKGVNVSYREFGYGHLEFSATVAHDLQTYVLERLKCHPS